MSVLKNRMGIWLVIALVALWMALNAFSDKLFTHDKRNCFIKDGRLYCVEILWDDMTIREEEVPSTMWG